MKLKRYFSAATFVAVLSVGSAFADGEAWTSDFEAAKKQDAALKVQE